MSKKIDRDAVIKATETLKKYQMGKKNLDDRIRENEQWFKLQHWRGLRDQSNKRRQNGQLHAAIVNKHADFMDNLPEITVLPREPQDQQAAEALKEILPVVLERGGFQEAYDKASWDKCKFGCGVYSVLWDPQMDNGLGNIRVQRAEALNIYWEPGIEDIQNSENLFILELMDHSVLRQTYPKNHELDRMGPPSETMSTYVRNEAIDTSQKAVVVNWYYHNDDGKLHYCRYVQDIVLFASENEPEYEADGWYKHGLYPYVFDPFFYEPESPHGFGLIDTGRETQEDIDELNDAMMRNAKFAARRRWFVRENSRVNTEDFANEDNDFVRVAGSLDEMSIKEIPSELLGGVYVGILESKKADLKEMTYNRDVNSGGTESGSQTAAGIAALQESGSKASRAAIAGTYRAFKGVVAMVIELIRQFYNAPRYFRILGEDKSVEFTTFDNSMLQGRPMQGINMEFGDAEPVFDLDVKVSKQNAWSRQAANQDVMNFYNMGFFNPQMSVQSLACLEVLQIDNKEKLTQVISRNGQQQQFIEQFLPMLIQAAQMVDPQMAGAAQQAAVLAGVMQAQQIPAKGAAMKPAETDVNGKPVHTSNYMEKQRQIAANRTAPQ